MKQLIPVSPTILNIVLIRSIPKWISKSELPYRSVWYPWPFQMMLPSSQLLVERYSNAWELDTLCVYVDLINVCVIGTEFFPVKLLEVRLCPYSSLQIVVRLFEWPARDKRSYLQRIFMLGAFQILAGLDAEQPALTSVVSLLWTGAWVRWFPKESSNLHCSMILCFYVYVTKPGVEI